MGTGHHSIKIIKNITIAARGKPIDLPLGGCQDFCVNSFHC